MECKAIHGFFVNGIGTDMSVEAALATANNSAAGNIIDSGCYYGTTGTNLHGHIAGVVDILLAAKTTYYANIAYTRAGGTQLYYGISGVILKAVCAYL